MERNNSADFIASINFNSDKNYVRFLWKSAKIIIGDQITQIWAHDTKMIDLHEFLSKCSQNSRLFKARKHLTARSAAP